MCGIVGLIRPKPLSSRDTEAVRRCNDSMFHRGPDGFGEFTDAIPLSMRTAHLFMAMRRLSIVDLANGQQPLKNEDETVVVVVNGEIYNHVELRDELESKGHQLKTRSDCDVLAHLYEEHGSDFVHKLRGMFAFALWDHRKRRLIIGRDRMGEKPVYVHCTPQGVWFASELKVLLASGQVPFVLDAAGIDSYLHYSWIPEPQTPIAGVRKLAAGHLLIVDVDPWSCHEKCYWRIEDSPVLSANPVELVRAELETVGKQIVRADVPIGISLSGGFDSSLVAVLAARNVSTPIHAFTLGYEGSPGQDERHLAAELARDLGMQFHSLELSTSDMTAAFPRMAFDRDDPIGDLAGSGYYAISKAARSVGCPVLLQGQGVDELLWGYPWVMQAVIHTLRKFADDPVRAWEVLRANLPANLSRPQWVRFAYFLGGILAGWRTLSPGRGSARNQLVAYDLTDGFQISKQVVGSTYTTQFLERLKNTAQRPEDFFRYHTDGSRIDIQILTLLCRGYLLENGLSQGDRLSMAHSVELRLPLVDYRLAETLVGIQKHTPVYLEKPKNLLIEASRDLVPDYIVNRPKRGFTPPVAQWVKSLRAAYGADLIDGALVEQQVLKPDAARRLVDFKWRFGANYDMFQKYLALEFWCRGMQSVVKRSAEYSKTPIAREALYS